MGQVGRAVHLTMAHAAFDKRIEDRRGVKQLLAVDAAARSRAMGVEAETIVSQGRLRAVVGQAKAATRTSVIWSHVDARHDRTVEGRVRREIGEQKVSDRPEASAPKRAAEEGLTAQRAGL